MLVFIDESGCPGFKLEAGSTPLFTVALVLFEHDDDAMKAEQRIAALKLRLGLPRNFEFHFNKLSPVWREAYLREVSELKFQYCATTIVKAELRREDFKKPHAFYQHACELLFESSKSILNDATVVIDGGGSRVFRRELASWLRKRANEASAHRLIRKIKIQDSRHNELLQMADMVCGAIARAHSGKSDSTLYRQLISHREYIPPIPPI